MTHVRSAPSSTREAARPLNVRPLSLLDTLAIFDCRDLLSLAPSQFAPSLSSLEILAIFDVELGLIAEAVEVDEDVSAVPVPRLRT